MKLYTHIFILLISTNLYSQKRISVNEYIDKYKDIAIAEMKRSGIPASITLAQGILESESGNSTLARKANNHFGIKCHKWKGKKVYHDDDEEDECFRKYNSPEDSYKDHTNFLMGAKRYNFLFEYKSDDYKKWAKGLKKAGYATSRTYAEDLIRIIENNKLYKYDNGDYKKTEVTINTGDDEDFFIDVKRRKTYERNRIKYIIVEPGDDIKKISDEMDLFSWQLPKYNEIDKDAALTPGQVLYIQPKRWSAERGNDYHTVKQGETMYSICQLYGMKLKKLYRKNRMEPGTEPEVGQKLWLRSRKPKDAK